MAMRSGSSTRSKESMRADPAEPLHFPGKPDALEDMAKLAENRVVIENVSPEIDGGRFPAKAAVGDRFTVEADIFADGHDKIDAALLIRRADEEAWREAPMAFFDNDRWRGFAVVEENARYRYTLIAWRDLFASWRDEVAKKHAAGLPLAPRADRGPRPRRGDAAARASGRARRTGRRCETLLADLDRGGRRRGARSRCLMSQETRELMQRAGAAHRPHRAIRASWSSSSTASAPPSAPGTS